MKVAYAKLRFRNMTQIYIGENVSLFMKSFYFFDWLIAFIIHGASISNYFLYGFYKKRYNEKKEYITYRRLLKIQDICNKIIEDRQLCRDKIKFNNHFNNYLGRKWIDFNQCTLEEFDHFVNSVNSFFVKDNNGSRGIGVSEYKTEETDIRQLYRRLTKDKDNHYILEEKIIQTSELSKFHPWSVNTIRIVSVYDDKNDILYIMNARLRMGNKKNHADNFHFDGIVANIDIETGVITSVGHDIYNNAYIYHPITGKQIVGFKIPYWTDCKKFVENVARDIPSVRYIGWDIVVQQDGCFLLIEGNDNADHDIQQLHNCGLWKQYKKIMKTLS